ncbi:MAG: UDP-N-acetylmuramoyl-L-alanine--D-glutamate ligase [Alphaproteobacteria bacterium]|nr:UDP-N-acetylmuramoyl-L-alanine--D-glutamate ligase [Alphaproteobacteria bacterium]
MIPVHAFAGQPVAVMGLGRSGLAAAQALAAGGAMVHAWDDNGEARAEATKAGVALHDLSASDLSDMAVLVLSPGIPHSYPQPHPVAAEARAAGCDIICDVDLLGRAMPQARYVGITGTNGKSTVTALIGHVFQEAGLDVQVGGNLGLPALELAPLDANGWYVLEMSSYQLERTFSIAFEVAVLVNISTDHLDRHGGMDGYVAAKTRIFQDAGARQTAVVGVDDERSRAIAEMLETAGDRRVIRISGDRPVPDGVYVDAAGTLIDDTGDARTTHELSGVVTLPGRHNWQNAAAAWAACRAAGLTPDVIGPAVDCYPGLPHRQQLVAIIDGVAWVNDSKATNAAAASKALESYASVYWIAGGEAKEGGIAALAPLFGRIRHAYLIGEAAPDFAAALEGKVPYTLSGDLATAVAQVSATAGNGNGPGAVVLLSPACASFDQFRNFEARGEAFIDLVGRLPGQRSRP